MIPYAIGLDLGIASVGWAVVGLDEEDKPCGIVDLGVRVFDPAESTNKQKMASLAALRREKRSTRRLIRRRRYRKALIRRLIIDQHIITQEQMERLFDGNLPDIYRLRERAFYEPVSPAEFARILIHISQRRGFQSNRKNRTAENPIDANEKNGKSRGNEKSREKEKADEEGKLLDAVHQNQKWMSESGYHTIAEMYIHDERYQERKRNQKGVYTGTVSRDMVEREVRGVFAAQRKFGASFAAKDTEEEYCRILFYQRSFDEGPSSGPYRVDPIDRVGKSTLVRIPEKGETPQKPEIRAAKATYSFEYFKLLSDINNIRLISDRAVTPLDDGQRRKLINLALNPETAPQSVNFDKIRKLLEIPDGVTFSAVSYKSGKSIAENEKEAKFHHMKAFHEMYAAFGPERFSAFTQDQRNQLANILTLYSSPERIREQLRKYGFSEADIQTAVNSPGLDFSGFGHISVTVCRDLIPYLEAGKRYDEARTAAGYDFRAHNSTKAYKLRPLDKDDRISITSPVAIRAISQTIKVINAIIDERGCSPTYINVELAREMSKPKKARLQEESRQNGRRKENEAIMEKLREYLPRPGGMDLVKWRLFEEQKEKGAEDWCYSAYSLERIERARLFEPGYVEIDHIIPYSMSFDDSYKNKVLVLSKENREKGNRLPLEYLTGERRERFKQWVAIQYAEKPKSKSKEEEEAENKAKRQKRERLLKTAYTDEEQQRFTDRNLQDTRTISAFVKNYIEDNLEFALFKGKRRRHVTAVNGAVTAEMRKRWNIEKDRAKGDKHHAVDALVVVCTTDGMIRRISEEYKAQVEYQDGAGSGNGSRMTKRYHFPYPWKDFDSELHARVSYDQNHDAQEAIDRLRLPFYIENGIKVRNLFVSRMPRRKVTGSAHEDTLKTLREDSREEVKAKKSTSRKRNKRQDGEAEKSVKMAMVHKIPLNKLTKKNFPNYYRPQDDRLLYEAIKKRLEEYGYDGSKAFQEPFYKPKKDGTNGPLVKTVKIYEAATLPVFVYDGEKRDGNGRKVMADNGDTVRIDVFHIDGEGYYFIPIYVPDTLKPVLPNKACVASKPYSEWKEMKEEDFLFSLYHDDLFEITREKDLPMHKKKNKGDHLDDPKPTKCVKLYFSGVNIHVGTISGETHDDGYTCKVTFKSLSNVCKYTVDVLGHYHLVKREKREGFHRAKH